MNYVQVSTQVAIDLSTRYSARNLGLMEIPDDIPTTAELVLITRNPIHHIPALINKPDPAISFSFRVLLLGVKLVGHCMEPNK